jgi:hypothetical protein
MSCSGAEQLLLFGSGTGASSAMDGLMAELQRHHREIAGRVIGSVVVDERHLTEDQLLARAREFYAAASAKDAISAAPPPRAGGCRRHNAGRSHRRRTLERGVSAKGWSRDERCSDESEAIELRRLSQELAACSHGVSPLRLFAPATSRTLGGTPTKWSITSWKSKRSMAARGLGL